MKLTFETIYIPKKNTMTIIATTETIKIWVKGLPLSSLWAKSFQSSTIVFAFWETVIGQKHLFMQLEDLIIHILARNKFYYLNHLILTWAFYEYKINSGIITVKEGGPQERNLPVILLTVVLYLVIGLSSLFLSLSSISTD